MVHRPSSSRSAQIQFPPRDSSTSGMLPRIEGSLLESASRQGAPGESREDASSRLEKAQKVLASERRGVSCRDVLSALDQQSWALSQPVGPRNLELTLQICMLNKDLRTEYQAHRASETIMDKLLSALPVVGESSPHERYLQSICDVNELVCELQEAGLVRAVARTTTSGVMTGRFPGVVMHSLLTHVLAPTELGRQMLQAQP